MSGVKKNTTNYFPRGSKKKSDAESNFIFNSQKTTKKAKSRDAEKSFSKQKKRTKKNQMKSFETEDIFAGKGEESEELEEVVVNTNTVPSFKPTKGSLLLTAVHEVYNKKYIICNYTGNQKGYMAAENGQISNKRTGDMIFSVVVSTQSKKSDSVSHKKSKKLQLTDNLHIYNTFLTAEKLVKNMVLRGVVERKEDKGYVVDLCLKDQTKAFLNFKDYDGKELNLGTHVSVVVKSTKSSSQKIVKCRHLSSIEDITEAVVKSSSVNYEHVKPGFLFNCTVEKVVDNGINVSFCKGITGVISLDHLKEKLSKYKKGQEVLARVVFVDFDQKLIGLSELPHIVNLKPTRPNLKIGDVLSKVKVINHVQGKLYLVEGKSKNTGENVKCLYHKSFITLDSKVNKRAAKDKFKLSKGQKIEGDIVVREFNFFDGMPIASSPPEESKNTVLNWDSIRGGQTYQVVVKQIVGEDYASVELNEFMNGRLYREHMTDYPQKRISKKIKSSVGQKITVKVWRVVKDKKIIEFTMKESLLKEKVFVPTDYNDPRVSNGTEITGILSKEHSQGFILEFYNGRKGYLPTRNLEKYNKKFSYVKGSLIQCYLLYKAPKGLDLTINKEESVNYKPKTEGTKNSKNRDSKIPSEKTFKVGEKIKAVVTKFDGTKSFPLVLKLSDKQYGYVFFGDLGLEETDDLDSLKTIFEPGSLLENVYVKTMKEQIDKEPRIECSLTKPDETKQKFDIGSKALCRYVKFKPGFGATVQITFKQYGFIDLCEIEDDIVPGVEQKLKDKIFFFARIIDVYKSKPQLSTRQTILDDKSYGLLTNDCTSLEFKEHFGDQKEKGDLRNFIMKYHNWRQLLTENMIVRGYVSTINQHGVFIKLARNFTARASMKEITDSGPTVSAANFLSLNTVALARITSFQKDKVHISLRESILFYGIEEVDITEITPGVKAKLLVLTVGDNLAYCQIIGSPYKCRVKLQKSDPKVVPEQKIIARVKSVDTSGQMPSITMHEIEECNEEHNEEYYKMQALMNQVKEVQKADHQQMEEDEQAEDEEQDIIQHDIKELLEHEDESEDDEINEEAKKITQYLKLDQDGEGEDQEMDDEDEDVQDDSEVEQTEVVKEKPQEEDSKIEGSKKEKGKSMHSHIQDEIQIMLQERDLAESDHDDKYYERMLIAEPNNSYLWIHYISYALEKQGYEHAKTLCERAVKTIDITNLKEKLNLWTAYMNLEIKFGDEEEFKKIVQRALKVNDPKTIYLTVIDCYTKSKKNYKMIEAMYLVLTKKYNFHVDVWKRYFEFLFLAHHIKGNRKHEDHILLQDVDLTEKEKALSKSLQIITERKPQVELITKYAIEEYKYGGYEKGKTMFESIIHSYPKRTDVISTFLDMEIKYVKKNMSTIFDKLLARDNIKINQTKFLFKRYLEYQVQYGSEKDVEKVKQKAAEFATKIGKSEEGEGESDSESEQAENEGEGVPQDAEDDQEMEDESSEDSE